VQDTADSKHQRSLAFIQ